jgi:carbon monoxide dehydrogenase subunit G
MLPRLASIRKERKIDAAPEDVWDALRDWGAVHERLVPGFVVGTELDGEDRIVTFFNGAVAREVLIDLDEESRRLVWSVVDGPYSHHNGAAQVHPDGDGGTLFVWTADLLPNEAAEPTAAMMERGVETVKQTLEAAAGPAPRP